VRSYQDEKAGQLLLRFHRRKTIVPTYREQTDNGSEFALEFETATARLAIQRYFSRVKTPKDNPEIERFNETLEYEWLYNFNLSSDPEELNRWLTE
jgi:transposase InsO family protein